jgi:putative nucleotidyltransferase with HDIG domain
MDKIHSSFNIENPAEVLQGILESISGVAESKDLDSLLLMLTQMAHRLVYSDRCTIWVYDADQGILWSRLADGIERIEAPANQGVVGAVVTTGKALIINDPYNDSRFNLAVDKKTGYLTKSIIAIPLKNGEGDIVGVFQALNKLDGNGFSESDLNLLQFVTVYIAREIDAAVLRSDLEATQNEIIFTLAETGEMRSKETGNHVKRVAEYSAFLAKEYGLSQKDQDIIRISASLHDIGKIAIPDEVLLKPGRLTPDERVIMETHSKLGYDMLKHSRRKVLVASATIAHEHQEKWDGTGYPQGLSGGDIHIFGRIVAVADVFDALGSERCYKKAWPMDKIIDLFKEERGKHFDPKLVDIFFEHIEVFKGIRELYQDSF